MIKCYQASRRSTRAEAADLTSTEALIAHVKRATSSSPGREHLAVPAPELANRVFDDAIVEAACEAWRHLVAKASAMRQFASAHRGAEDTGEKK